MTITIHERIVSFISYTRHKKTYDDEFKIGQRFNKGVPIPDYLYNSTISSSQVFY